MTTKTPLISVIVPVYNGSEFLKSCVKSILTQDYDNLELIIIDDGSTDSTKKEALALSASDHRIRFFHQKNSGVSCARNLGITNAKGKYLTFVDVDDLLAKNFLSYHYKNLKKYHAEISLCPSPFKFKSTACPQPLQPRNQTTIWPGKKAAEEMLYYNIAIGPWNKLISKKLIDKYSLRFNTNLAYGEGFNFSIDCFQRAKKVAVGNQKLYYYRVDNPDSVMTKFRPKLVTGSLEAQENIQKNLVNPTSKLLKACRYANWHTGCDCFNTIVGCKVAKEYPDLYLKTKKICRKGASSAFTTHIPKIDKLKAVLYLISPLLTAHLINSLRLRKFTKT